jgi:hypothetical protein
VAENRLSPTEQEREQLREFVRVVATMGRRRFLKEYARQDHSVNFGSELQGPHYDREDLEAFLTDLRKVAMSDSEPIYLTNVLVTVGKYASDDLRSNLKRFRRVIIPLLEGRTSLMQIGYDRDRDEARLSEAQILDVLVNGEIFHADPQHTRTAGILRGMQPLFYLWPTIHFFIIPIVRACSWLFHAIWRDGILEREDYPAFCRPPDQSGKPPATSSST